MVGLNRVYSRLDRLYSRLEEVMVCLNRVYGLLDRLYSKYDEDMVGLNLDTGRLDRLYILGSRSWWGWIELMIGGIDFMVGWIEFLDVPLYESMTLSVRIPISLGLCMLFFSQIMAHSISNTIIYLFT